ncbi:MAG: type VI secretion system baseplate subunit TssG [Desulfobacterales bacterium]|nr:type VI secretion system baseplate subunit TssG [Desulfobacterales bacterium]
MGTRSRGTDSPLERTIFDKGYSFNFFQAVKLLEILYPEQNSVGAHSEPAREPVRFTSRVSLEFPAGDINQIAAPDGEGDPADMAVNIMGLAGALGPLPTAYTELILERVRKKDTALRDFLDIFNHRLISMFYRVRKISRIGFDFNSPQRSNVARYLYSLMGLGTAGLQQRMHVPDRALLFYTAHFARQGRSMVGLESLLCDYFGVTVKGRQFKGQYHRIADDQITMIGISGQNQILGDTATIGTRVWDQQGKFELHVGPLTAEELLVFLPDGTAFAPLCELTRFYVGNELDFKIILIAQKGDIPTPRLGGTFNPRLGWTSWLGTRERETDNDTVRLSPHLLTSMQEGMVAQ